ncbi:hypothetical protein C8Q70DRAFT_4934 [Cubamyces menziesii]|nr:hypothetical protein C8Q70DRAFT_4934 [Cubamyces menziesii]
MLLVFALSYQACLLPPITILSQFKQHSNKASPPHHIAVLYMENKHETLSNVCKILNSSANAQELIYICTHDNSGSKSHALTI